MSFFSKPKAVIYPKAKTLEIYLDKKENNVFSFDVNLWEERAKTDLDPIVFFLRQNHIESCSVLVPDDVVLTKSFIYDTKIQEIDKKEVIGLAESFVNFKIDPEAIEYVLIQQETKTLIRAQIYEPQKIFAFKNNLSQLNLRINSLKPVSSAIVETISEVNKEDFFLIYPQSEYEYALILCKQNLVYLTTILKGQVLDIQKIVNYSKLYFNSLTKKIYLPEGRQLEIVSTTKLEQTVYSESQIAQTHGKASNIPIPVISELSVSNPNNAVIINQPADISSSPKKSMENKKNILPIVAVFIFTAALASIIIWFVLNRNNTENTEISETEQTQTENVIPTDIPTSIPTPQVTVAEISKTIKIQVLNGTDINGQAATVKNMLTKLGFTNVTVGNSKETATENSIQLKSTLTGADAYFEAKMPDFPATITTDLAKTSSYDAVFTIGTDLSTGASLTTRTTTDEDTVTPTKKVTATPTAKTTPKATPTVED